MTELVVGWPERKNEKTWLTIGNFDGLHLGHQALINTLLERASSSNSRSALITFWPHPRVFFQHITTAFYLTTQEEKLSLLSKCGLDQVITLPFDQAMASESAEEFIDSLRAHVNLAGLLVGKNFVLGRNREGTLDVIQALCSRRGIEFEVIQPFLLDGKPVSSRRVRAALAAGEVQKVTRLLGRPYALTDVVKEGKHLGSKLGFPTANQIVDPMKLLPKYGVYATVAWVAGTPNMGVTSVGVRPTFENTTHPNVETLLLDFDGNIYHKNLTIHFFQRLRDELKFENVNDLIAQIEVDKTQARRILKNGPFA